MNLINKITLVLLMFLLSHTGHTTSYGWNDNASWGLTQDCIHQEQDTVNGVVVYDKAYKYATVPTGEICPPFDKSAEVPWNEVTRLARVSWGGIAVPQIDDLGGASECNVGQEVCDDTTGACMIILNCSNKDLSPADHSCRFGQGGNEG